MIQQRISGIVYGVILNDQVSLSKIGSLTEAPYKGMPKAPALYIKPANTYRTADAAVILPEGAKAVEVGATIGLVMGCCAARLDVGNAMAAVSGLVLAADLSLPHSNYYRPAIREKCFDGALPLGPVMPLIDLATIELITSIDGKLAEQRLLADLLRNPAQLLAEVTSFMTLRQGDVLLVGVSYMAPLARPGSQVAIRAKGLGDLHFSISAQGARQ